MTTKLTAGITIIALVLGSLFLIDYGENEKSDASPPGVIEHSDELDPASLAPDLEQGSDPIQPAGSDESSAVAIGSVEETLEAIWKELGSGRKEKHPALAGNLRELAALPADDVFDACRRIDDPDKRKRLSQAAVEALGREKPQACLAFIEDEPRSNRPELARTVLTKWVEDAPEDAQNWFLENELNEEGVVLGSDAARDTVAYQMTTRLAAQGDIEGAIVFATRLTGEARQAMALDGALAKMDREDLPEVAMRLIESGRNVDATAQATGKIGERIVGSGDLKEGINWALGLKVLDGTLFSAAAEGVATAWIRTEPRAAADWWISQSGDDALPRTYESIVKQWVTTTPNQVGEWFGSQPQTEGLDLARVAFARAVLDRDRESAIAWAQSIRNENLRMGLIAEIELKN